MATSSSKHGAKPASKAHIKVAKSDNVPVPPGPDAVVPVEGMPSFRAVQLDKRYVPARLPTGKVMEVWGDALIRTPEGSVRQLVPGDEIRKGDVILTAQNGIVQMEADGSRFARQPFGAELQGPVAQVNATDDFDAPGAGLGDLGGLAEGLRIDRINETVTGQSFRFDGPGDGSGAGAFPVNNGTTAGTFVDAGNLRPEVDLQSILVPESGVVIAGGVQAAAVAGSPGFAVFTVHLDIPAVDPVPIALVLTAETAAVGTTAQGGDFGVAGDPLLGMQVSIDDGQTWVAGNSVTVPVGQTQALVRVPVSDDAIDEFDESFRLTATRTTPTGEIVVLNAQATIVDNDPAPNVATSDVTIDEGTGTATFTLTLSSVSGKTVSVDWATGDGTGATAATTGEDFTGAGGTLTFLPGETTKTVTVAIINDKAVEAATEFFVVNLSNGVNVDITTPQVRGFIVDDDHAPTLVHQTPATQNEDVVQTGNVLTGATDQDQDPVTIVDYTVGTGAPTPAGTPVVIPGVGTVVIQPDGTYTFTPLPNYDGTVPPITYTASDGTNPVTETIQLTINPVNDAPTLDGTTSVTLSEEGLANGLADTVGTTDTTNVTTRSGQIAVSDPEGNAITLQLVAPPEIVTSNGLRLSWQSPTVGGVTDRHTLLGRVDGKTIVSATIDDAGNYKVDLLGPIDHAGLNAEDASTINFGVTATDSLGASATATLAVAVEDDAPTFDTTVRTGTVQTVNTNLMVVLDTSGSMAQADGLSLTTRLQSAVNAISNLIDRYDLQGDVMVRLVTFATTAQDGGTWMTVAQARTALAAVLAAGPDGDSDYHAALATAQAAFGGGGIANAQNISYFVSDGAPTIPIGAEPLTPAEVDRWTGFVAANAIKSVAIGLGADAAAGQLDLISYDGATGANTTAHLVTNVDQLDSVVAGTVPSALGGFLSGPSATATGGADGGYVSKLHVDGTDYSFAGHQPSQAIVASKGTAGVDYTYDPLTHVLVVNLSQGGKLTVDMDDGKYGYEPPATVTNAITEKVDYTIGDRDGDTLASSILINVPQPSQAGAASLPSAGTLAASTADGADIQHATPLADVFSWQLADAGAPGSPSTTHVAEFGIAPASAGGDTLDLRDLLLGEMAGPQGGIGNLGHYLDFSVTGSGTQASTSVLVSTHGGLDGSQPAASLADKVIVLDGIDLRGSLGLDAHAANQQIIETLLHQGKLTVDGSTA
ncbi:MAG: hypothetical protein RLZZ584_475 [Pseudomonadota bacterium]